MDDHEAAAADVTSNRYTAVSAKSRRDGGIDGVPPRLSSSTPA